MTETHDDCVAGNAPGPGPSPDIMCYLSSSTSTTTMSKIVFLFKMLCQLAPNARCLRNTKIWAIILDKLASLQLLYLSECTLWACQSAIICSDHSLKAFPSSRFFYKFSGTSIQWFIFVYNLLCSTDSML